MSGKREHEENEEEGNLLESKRQKVSEEDSSPPASLLPGFNYGDEDDEERRAAVNGEGDGKLVLAGHNGAEEEEEEEEDEEQGLYQHRSREIEVRRDCPYLDSVNRQVLDFDFEKFCSLSLSNLNVYACLVCGKYYQGRGRKSHAYTHSLEAGHHVFINLRTEKVYCLPDGYEISDPSLDDIRHVLNPREVCANMHLRSISLNSDAYWSCLRRNRLSRLTETSSGRGHLMVLITFLEWWG